MVSTHNDAITQDGVYGVYDDFGDVWRLGDVGEKPSRASWCVAFVDESPDQAREAECDVHGRECEHSHGYTEDHRGDVPGAAKAHNINIRPEQAEVDAYSGYADEQTVHGRQKERQTIEESFEPDGDKVGSVEGDVHSRWS